MFKPCEDCALGKAKQCAVSKKAVPHLQSLGKRLFFVIRSPSTPTFGRKHYWLLVIDDCSDYSWCFFLKEKSDLKKLKIKFNLQVQYLQCDNAGKNQASKKSAHRKGWGSTSIIQPQLHLNKMGMVSASLPHFSTEYMPCLTVANLMSPYEVASGQKLQTLPCFLRTV